MSFIPLHLCSGSFSASLEVFLLRLASQAARQMAAAAVPSRSRRDLDFGDRRFLCWFLLRSFDDWLVS